MLYVQVGFFIGDIICIAFLDSTIREILKIHLLLTSGYLLGVYNTARLGARFWMWVTIHEVWGLSWALDVWGIIYLQIVFSCMYSIGSIETTNMN